MMSDLLCLVERRFGPSKFLTSFLSAVRGGKRKLDVMEAEGGARRQGSLPVRREGGREGRGEPRRHFETHRPRMRRQGSLPVRREGERGRERGSEGVREQRMLGEISIAYEAA